MKKFLSIFIAVAMLMSFAGVFAGAPTAMAATDSIYLTDAGSYLEWFGVPVPDFGVEGIYNINPTPPAAAADKLKVYKMGETIHGLLLDGTGVALATTVPWKVELVTTDASATVIDTVNMAAGSSSFTMGTGNVSYDGTYKLVATSSGADFSQITFSPVYIQYNLALSASEITICDATQTISGWITRGSGQTVLTAVDVYLAYPSTDATAGGALAGYYTVAAGSSGQFTITFPVDPDINIGDFHLYIRDGYDVTDTAIDNDAMIYETLNNEPTSELILSTYVKVVDADDNEIADAPIYKNLAGQPYLLAVTDQDDNYVTGLLVTDFDVVHNTGSDPTVSAFDEISPGFYKFTLDTTPGGLTPSDIRFSVSKKIYDTTVYSNTVIIGLRTLDVFNPFVDVDAYYAIPTYGLGPDSICETARDVYDLLPCTIGTGLEIVVNYYPVADPVNWYIAYADTDVSGAARVYDGGWTDRYIIEEAGKIRASIYMIAWERIDTDCPIGTPSPGWANYQDPTDEQLYEMSTNACCHEFTKLFKICDVDSCTFNGAALVNGDQVDDTTIVVGDNADLQLNIGEDNTAALECGCNSKIIHIFMTDSECEIVDDAFTMDTYAGSTKDVTEIWWNPLGIVEAPGTLIPDIPITFGATDTELKINDNCSVVTFGGFTPNFVNTEDECGYNIVIQVFGMERHYDACGNISITYPMVYEGVNDIDILPITTELTTTAIITEGQIDPDTILAGVAPAIDITDPGFDPYRVVNWDYYFNGLPLWYYNYLYDCSIDVTVSVTDTGYRFNFDCPFSEAGTFVIYGYALGDYCETKEEVTIEIDVEMPEFTVQIGLSDGAVIDNDGIITEGFAEDIYVDATDPRGIHDFTDSSWTLAVLATYNDCLLPTSSVCGEPCVEGCAQPSPIEVGGYGNPYVEDEAQFDLYFVVDGCAWIYVDTFTITPPTVVADPTEVPFTIPASATHLTFTVTDAHAHGAPLVPVTVVGDFSAGAAGYGWAASAGYTGMNGEVDWAFVPPYSGMYIVGTSFTAVCPLPCGWLGISGSALIEAVYQAPVLDTEAPVVTAEAGEVAEGAVTISGTVEDNVGVVSLYIGAMKVDFAPDGAFSAVVALSEGENVIKVVAFDAAGNKGEVALTVDYAVPTVTVVKVQIGSDIMTVNGQIAQLDAVAEIKEGHTYLPLRQIGEALGAEVTWIPETKGITLVLGDSTVGLQIGNVSAVVNGNVVAIFPPYLKPYGDGGFAATMVPARLISEGLGAEVGWDPALRLVTITLVQP